MQSFRKRAALLVPAIVLSLTAAACGGDDDDEPGASGGENEGAQGGTYSAYLGEPTTLVPTNTTESEGNLVEGALFYGLVTYDPETNEAENALAESIESDDQKTWTIKLKEGYTFHDGTPVTAQDFVASWNYASYAPNAQETSYFFENIQGYDDLQSASDATPAPAPKAKEMSGLKAVDDTTIEVTLKEPFSQYPITLGYNAFYPMPKAFFADPKKYNEAPIGNGPYKMEGTWRHDEGITLVRYEDFKGEPGKADKIELKIYGDVAVAYTDLQAGNLDIVDQIPPEQIASAKAEFGERFSEEPNSAFTYVGFPVYLKEFQNADLRRAISLAIDRDAIIKAIFQGTRKKAGSLVSPVVAGSREDACKYCEYDVEQAKELFAKAGGFKGKLTLWFNSGAGHDKWMEAVANQLRTNLGITDIAFQQEDFSEYIPRANANKFTGPFRLAWVMDYPSPQNYLQPIYSTTGSSNNTGYSNPEVDKLIEEGNASESIEDGLAKYQEAEDLILEDMPVAPMWFGFNQTVWSENVDNVDVDAFGSLRLEDVTVVNAAG